MVQESKVSFEYVDFLTKMSLILDPAFGNQKTKWTLVFTDLRFLHMARSVKEIFEKNCKTIQWDLHSSAGIRLTLKSHVLTKVVDFCT